MASNHRLASLDFDIMCGDIMLHVISMSASISDNSKSAYTRGVPDGPLKGDVSCSGDIELDSANFELIGKAAAAKGSWRDLEPFDIVCIGKTGTAEQKLELYGCLIVVSDLLGLDDKGGDKTKHKLKFEVTSPDFVRINGTPYLSAKDTRNFK